MDIKDFDVLKKKIEAANAKKERAVGALEQIKEKLNTDYNIETIEDGYTMLEKIDYRINKSKEKYDSMMKELDNMVDWSNL